MRIQVDHESYLSKHDIVHLSPPRQGWEGLLLGNGSFGGPLWATRDGLAFQANHTDSCECHSAPNREGYLTVHRSCGQLTIEPEVPQHEWLSLNDFSARLSMYRAEAEFNTKSAFGENRTSAFIHAGHPVAVFRCSTAWTGDLAKAGMPVRIRLERWGSRVCMYWYSQLKGGATIGLGETVASVDRGDICVVTRFEGMSVALRCRVVGAPAAARVIHAHQTELEVAAAPRQEFTVLLACVTSREADDPVATSRTALDTVAALTDVTAGHRAWWAKFWERSFLHIPNDYIENLYYLHHYLMGASCRGNLPPLFNGGIWLWNRDVRNWLNPHHWNEQQSFWCLAAANRPELLRPYLDTYHRLMPKAIAATRRRGFDGLLWMEAHDFAGNQLGEGAPSFRDNYTPAAQIALFFWWYFRHTGDTAYLREKGYPYLNAVGDFYLSLLQWKEAEGRYMVPLASTYEDERPLRFTDTITNLAMIRAVFPALLAASKVLNVDADKQARWQHVLDHLPPFLLNDRDQARGITPASGRLENGEPPEKEDHNHGPLFCPVFPAGVVGLKDAGTPIFAAEQNALVTYGNYVAITPVVCIAARLGMAKEALHFLEYGVRNLQQFSNGTFFNIDHWHYLSRRVSLAAGPAQDGSGFARFQRDYLDDRNCRFSPVRIVDSPEDGVADHKTSLPCDPFSQMGMETLGHLTAGLQEMLLQSHEGVIRVFPAAPADWPCAFILHAEGGFLVASRREAGQPAAFIEIRSEQGGCCSVVSPWPAPKLQHNGKSVLFTTAGNEVSFDTEAGGDYLLLPQAAATPAVTAFAGERNNAPKQFHEARIGLDRDF